MKTIRVILADDHPIVRKGIRNLLNRTPDITVVGEACDGNEAIALVGDLDPDVLLLDMEMPGMGGVEVARHLKQAQARVRVLVLSAYNDKEYISELLGLGASGYLIKDEAPSRIVEAVRGVARGERNWLSQVIEERITTWKHEIQGENTHLTHREREILRLLSEGQNERAIGAALGMSDVTVQKFLQQLFGKLGVASYDEAVHQVHSQK